jgi:hypothetical protein
MLDRNYCLGAVWTPEVVGETLIDAGWLAIITEGRVGPAQVRSLMPVVQMSGPERMAAGWDFAVGIDDEEIARRRRRSLSPARVSFLLRAMEWPKNYLADEPGAARLLQLWVACKTSRKRYSGELKRRGLARATAYRKRDRALSLISVGLDRDGVTMVEA